MTVTQLGRLLRTGKTSCVELIEHTIAEIKRRDTFHTFITLNSEHAMELAIALDKELAAGMDRGPFHGIPIAYKDLFYTRGIRTTAGSLLYRDFVPSWDATVVSRLAAGGAVSVGKTNLHELAYGATSKNPHYGFVLNPHHREHIAGGSSGGSATAVAAGFLPVTLGTDTGGSIRIPASYCGVVGLKPTYGRVSRNGVFPLAFSLDHVGPLGCSVEDCALMMNQIAGPDPQDDSCINAPPAEFNLPPLENLKNLRVGVPRNFFFDRVEQDVAEAVNNSIRAAERRGASLVDVTVPDLYDANLIARMIQFAESAAVYVNHRDPSQFGVDVWNLLQQGRLVSGADYVNAQRLRKRFRRSFDALWRKIDILVTPTTPVTAPRVVDDAVMVAGELEDARIASTRLVRAINLIGEPALSMPCGRSAAGLPIGLQLISPPYTEPQLLQVARTLEPLLQQT